MEKSEIILTYARHEGDTGSPEVQIALLDPAAWQQRHADHISGDAERLARAYEYFQARQRQIAAVLEAHGIPVTFAYCSAASDARESLQT